MYTQITACLVIIIIYVLNIKLCECVSYRNYTLYRAIPVNDEQVQFLANLPNKYKVQLWKPPGLALRSVDFTIAPKDKKKFLVDANQTQLYLTTISSNVQELFNKQTVKSYIRRQMTSYDWHNYYRVDDTYNWLKDLATANPENVKLSSIGTTIEKRDIIAVHVLLGSNRNADKMPTFIVEGGIHAREWISPAFVTYLIYKVVHAATDSDEDFRRIAYTYNWIFVPLLNPDGYEYSHTQDRLWRKNRNGHGVDINRNFDSAFGTVGISQNPKKDTYCGPKAFSENESVALATLVEKHKDNLKYFISFHSYGQYMIIPYAHMKQHVGNFDEVKMMGLEVARHIRKRYSREYTVGTAYDTVGYITSGVSGCWIKRAYDVPYVMTFELRDDGREGFALSPENIIPTCEETIDGLVAFLDPNRKYNLDYTEDRQINSSSDSCLKNVVLFINFIVFITFCFEYSLVFY